MTTDATEEVRHFLQNDISKAWYGGSENFSPGGVLIRPSGNPLTLEEWSDFCKKTMTILEEKILDVENLRVKGDVAWAVVKVFQRFEFQGTPNEDTARITVILERDPGAKWKIAHMHRSTALK